MNFRTKSYVDVNLESLVRVIGALLILIAPLLLALSLQIGDVHSAPLCQDSCDVSGGTFGCDDSGPGGENPPQPDPDPDPPDDPDDDPDDNPDPPDPGDPDPDPDPDPEPDNPEITNYHCYAAPGCPSGYADLQLVRGPDGRYWIRNITCLPLEACVPEDPPDDPDPRFPCDYPPTVDGGIIRQPCERWPGWYIDVEVSIPPADVLRHPWPRGLVGYPNRFWYLGAGDVEAWSEEKALECSGIDYGKKYDSNTFDCGGSVGNVTANANVNYQLGAAWRHWTPAAGAIFGQTPPSEQLWTVHDRPENGGDRAFLDPSISYVFETSSWGQPADGPSWNPECQDRTCSYDERVLNLRDTESYHVSVQTFWWPEWNMRWDRYKCVERKCDDVWVWDDPTCTVHGCDGHWDEDCYCDKWGWSRRTAGWEKYDLRDLGADPLVPWGAVRVAGADENGNRQGSWIGAWGSYIPVPVIEVQPVGTE